MGRPVSRKGQLTQLRELVHPEAGIQMLFLAGDVARGPDGLGKALREAADSIHKPTGTHVERIDDHAAILVGRSATRTWEDGQRLQKTAA